MQPTALPDYKNKITNLQIATIFICFLMNMLDGMDVMVISYTAPNIAKEWAVKSSALGIVFSMGLMGMAIGAMLLAPRADIIGRRNMILICAVLMGACVFTTQFAQSKEQMIFFRIISGIGIGGMLASTATLASEYAPKKNKDFWISFVMSGYPIGAVLSGMVAAQVIPAEGWRAMFRLAGIATVLTLPIIYLFLSESLTFLLETQPSNALNRANAILTKMNAAPISGLPPIQTKNKQASILSLFSENRRDATVQLWVAIFMAFSALYFLTMWIPKLASGAGMSESLAIYAGTVFNSGAFFGIVSQGYLSDKFGLRKVIFYYLVSTAVLMCVFGFFNGSSMVLIILFGLLGFGIQGGFIGLYAVAARLYPTEIRTTGIGAAIGLGRIGAIVGPLLGGFLIDAGLSMTNNFIIFAIPTLIAGLVALMIKMK